MTLFKRLEALEIAAAARRIKSDVDRALRVNSLLASHDPRFAATKARLIEILAIARARRDAQDLL
ncbi:MAG TPA: hypothetical protein VHC91_21905 [Trinickia sp.]|uniref:hypothetical protein n=1 Tax=Trinickia sp. TaxID=2571163 RepID=UPI002CA266D2|nr:hypothetical protein [Trinickia sp.]HVW53019.1 hypothetical protein [Trinickia sp.]